MANSALRAVGLGLRFCIELFVACVALTSCAGAVGAHGGRWSDRLDLLTHFAPLWLFAGAASLLAALIFMGAWRRWTFAFVALVAVVASCGLMAVDLRRLPERYAAADPSQTLKIIEFNAWVRNGDYGAIARWLVQEDPDIVVLPEGLPALAEVVRTSTKLNVFEGSGAIIASRSVPTEKNTSWGARFLPGRPTEMTWVTLPGPDGRPFTMMGVHAGWPIPASHAWADDQRIAAVLGLVDRSRTILAGDFNSTQWSFRQRVADRWFGLERRDRLNPTWPARLPMFHGVPFPAPFASIDHIYAGSAWRTVSVRKGPRLGSDHYPLIAVLAWEQTTAAAP